MVLLFCDRPQFLISAQLLPWMPDDVKDDIMMFGRRNNKAAASSQPLINDALNPGD